MAKFRAGLRGCGPNAVLCKTCSVLCVLEQLSVYIYNSSAGPLFVGSNWLTASSDEVYKAIPYLKYCGLYLISHYLKIYIFNITLFIFTIALFVFNITLFVFNITLFVFKITSFIFNITLFIFNIT